MPPDDITDLVTHDGRQEGGFPEGIYVRFPAGFTNTTRHTEMLNKRVQATKDEYSKQGMVRDGIPGADPSRWTLNPLIDACFIYMSNALTQIDHIQDPRNVCSNYMSSALTQIDHIQDPRDVKAAASEMDDYHFYLRALHNNATRYAGCETEAGFNPASEDSIAGVKDAVQGSLRPLELEVTQKYLEHWGSQQDPPRTLDVDKFKAHVKGWESIEEFRDALSSELHHATEH